MSKRLLKKVIALDGDKMKFRFVTDERKGGSGFGMSDDGVMYTLNTIDKHMVAIVYGNKKTSENK